MTRAALGITAPLRRQRRLCETRAVLISSISLDGTILSVTTSRLDPTYLKEKAYLLPWWDCWPFYPEVSWLGHIDPLHTQHGVYGSIMCTWHTQWATSGRMFACYLVPWALQLFPFQAQQSLSCTTGQPVPCLLPPHRGEERRGEGVCY